MGDHNEINRSIKQNLFHSFVELENLEYYGNEARWVERARWIKLEEDVDVLTNQWCPPYIPALSYKAFSALKACLESGSICIGLRASCMGDISTYIVDTMLGKRLITTENKNNLLEILNAKHRHVRKETEPSRIGRKWLSAARKTRHYGSRRNTVISIELHKVNTTQT